MEHATNRARVFVIEDHAIVLSGLVGLLTDQDDLVFCGSAHCATQAVAAATNARADLILLDLRLGDADGSLLIEPLTAALPDAAILVLSMHDERLFAERMIARGARGFIGKGEAPMEVLRALRAVRRGDTWLGAAISERLEKRAADGRKADIAVPERVLSPREMQVFRLLADGADLNRVASALDMGLKTADTHRRNIRSKLGLESSAELQRYALLWSRDAASS
jgi:DNA-binding NarL/FixJ family response regulator